MFFCTVMLWELHPVSQIFTSHQISKFEIKLFLFFQSQCWYVTDKNSEIILQPSHHNVWDSLKTSGVRKISNSAGAVKNMSLLHRHSVFCLWFTNGLFKKWFLFLTCISIDEPTSSNVNIVHTLIHLLVTLNSTMNSTIQWLVYIYIWCMYISFK